MSNAVAEREDGAVAEVQGAASIMAVIERAATNPDTDIEKMERLMQMYERMQAKQAEQAFNSALTQMQANLPSITEGGKIKHNGKVISEFARWDEDILPVVRPILRDYGFSLSFRVDTSGESVKVRGVLGHESGHAESTEITLPTDVSGAKNAVQAVASSVSYGKRYTGSALLNLACVGTDDDGNGANTKAQPITEEQEAELKSLLDKLPKAQQDGFFKWAKVRNLSQIAQGAYESTHSALRRKVDQLQQPDQKENAE